MKKNVGYPIHFGKNPEWDIFHVYSDMPRAKQATAEMKLACDKFASDFKRISIKYRTEGLDDSESRYSAIRYVLESIEPVRKALRLREEARMSKILRRK